MMPSIRDRVLSLLADIDSTRNEMEAALGCSHAGLHKAMTKLRADKLVYICQWDRPDGQGSFEATYRLGNKRDAKKPAPYSRPEISARQYARNIGRINARRWARKGLAPTPFSELLRMSR
jgi:hypothetical protein